MDDSTKSDLFEKTFWPYLGAAYNLARWLTHRDLDAQDVVQEAMIRAFHYFGGYRGANPKAWLLTIVRNTTYTWLRENRSQEFPGDSELELAGLEDKAPGPEAQALRQANEEVLRRALATLPLEFREVLVLRELEGLSYKEICDVSGLPMGTVMSRLARARGRLEQALGQQSGEIRHEL